MRRSERSAPRVLEEPKGPSVTTDNSRVRTSASHPFFRDSTGYLRCDDIDLIAEAAELDAQADYEYGRPLDYNDPTGERAAWNVLVTETVSGRRSR